MKVKKVASNSSGYLPVRSLMQFAPSAMSAALGQSQPQQDTPANMPMDQIPSVQPLAQHIPTVMSNPQKTSPITAALAHYGDEANSSTQDLVSLVQKYFPKDQWANAMKIMQLESGGNPEAVGDKNIIPNDLSEKLGHPIPSYGLYQIRALPGRPDVEKLTDPEFNIKYAADLFKAQGWSPWQNSAKKLGLL